MIYLWTFCLALTVLGVVRLARAADANNARAASAEIAAAHAQAAALRLQLNPHFLFNTLNSISSLVLVDRKQDAEVMITRLCDFLRGSLDSDPLGDVPLAQEFEVIEAYLDIEATRFGDELSIEFDLESAVMGAAVPNFILQPLVENAIKHGVAKARAPSIIQIVAKGEGDVLVLRIANSAPADKAERAPLDGTRKREGIGLANIRERLAKRYGKAASLGVARIGDDFHATIRMPLVGATPAATEPSH
ncbi:sensor histidine kinase [Sphingomonas natans]|uniref:sensor histidine kinase n=1 Tax=Sphingomonas natans TaxID=3063330 RepID=UPI0026E250B4|nr:histidine kinase [Sphingomonas sp. BIUV-7]